MKARKPFARSVRNRTCGVMVGVAAVCGGLVLGAPSAQAGPGGTSVTSICKAAIGQGANVSGVPMSPRDALKPTFYAECSGLNTSERFQVKGTCTRKILWFTRQVDVYGGWTLDGPSWVQCPNGWSSAKESQVARVKAADGKIYRQFDDYRY